MQIRTAQPSDIDSIWHELQCFSAEYPARGSLLGEEAYVRAELRRTMEHHFFVVAEDERGLAGFIAGLVAPHYFNPALQTLTEILWWVPKVRRHSRAGLLLIKAFTEWGRTHARWVVMSLEVSSPVNDRVLLREGYQMKERSYLLEV